MWRTLSKFPGCPIVLKEFGELVLLIKMNKKSFILTVLNSLQPDPSYLMDLVCCHCMRNV